LTAALRQLGFDVLPSQANFAWATRIDSSARRIFEELKERKILVRYMSYPDYGDGLRISVGTDAEVDRLLEELRTLV
jgi:histidinol-phosphate aminotransferase